jgi:hypothetical protein
MIFLRHLWTAIVAGLAAIAAVLMLGRLWRAIPGRVRTILRNIVGCILILIGIIGAILPIIPGHPFWIPGLLLLDFPQKRVALRRLQHSWPMRLLLQNQMVAQLWRHVRRQAKNSEVPGNASLPEPERVNRI